MRYRFGGLIFGGAYTWRGLFSEFYGTISVLLRMHVFIYSIVQGAHNGAKTSFFSGVYLLSSDCFSVLNRIILRHILSLQYSSFSLYMFQSGPLTPHCSIVSIALQRLFTLMI